MHTRYWITRLVAYSTVVLACAIAWRVVDVEAQQASYVRQDAPVLRQSVQIYRVARLDAGATNPATFLNPGDCSWDTVSDCMMCVYATGLHCVGHAGGADAAEEWEFAHGNLHPRRITPVALGFDGGVADAGARLYIAGAVHGTGEACTGQEPNSAPLKILPGTLCSPQKYAIEVDPAGGFINWTDGTPTRHRLCTEDDTRCGNFAVSGSGVATRVAYWDGTSHLVSDDAFYWDPTNNRLGVGEGIGTTPASSVHVRTGVNNVTSSRFLAESTSAGNFGEASFFAKDNAGNETAIGIFGSGTGTYGVITPASGWILNRGNPQFTIMSEGATGYIVFATGNTGSSALGEDGLTIPRSAGRWEINPSGHLLGFADNTYDIGASLATRPRTAYIGTSMVVGAATGGDLGGGKINSAGGFWKNGVEVTGSALSGLTTHGVVVAASSSTVTSTGTGTSGQALLSNGASADPTFQTISGVLSGLTNHGMVYATSATTVSSTAAPTNGQLLIGYTSNDPVLATITAGTGITVTNGGGTITIDATGAAGTPDPPYILDPGAGAVIFQEECNGSINGAWTTTGWSNTAADQTARFTSGNHRYDLASRSGWCIFQPALTGTSTKWTASVSLGSGDYMLQARIQIPSTYLSTITSDSFDFFVRLDDGTDANVVEIGTSVLTNAVRLRALGYHSSALDTDNRSTSGFIGPDTEFAITRHSTTYKFYVNNMWMGTQTATTATLNRVVLYSLDIDPGSSSPNPMWMMDHLRIYNSLYPL